MRMGGGGRKKLSHLSKVELGIPALLQINSSAENGSAFALSPYMPEAAINSALP
jgi:hypothetical protein